MEKTKIVRSHLSDVHKMHSDHTHFDAEHHARYGFGEILHRAALAVKRALFYSRLVVFYCDLGEQGACTVVIPSPLRIDQLRTEAEIRPQDLEGMTSFWNPKQARQNIRKRFERGASLWLIKSGDGLAGYGWTLQGHTMKPYYFPLGRSDAHLFDFYVFPQYRGRGMNPLLVSHILRNLATSCRGRAFIEAAEWNQAQLTSLQKTPFRRLGLARSFTVFGHTFVSWLDNKATGPLEKGGEQRDIALDDGDAARTKRNLQAR